ncbi:HAD-IA family hydrolase [Rossellomorea aquimaris]|uniref:HAD-IA family hydrolase n=1 Tax=Rossellomorea aquimaris TaxID=189382 RepID=UPI001CD3F84F|nr:HAD-IA family hydrolase [Rossellomorea aquimaris]MCA1053643.1 HAD-IA family hydrolase [Rossellomorea aquimaris]
MAFEGIILDLDQTLIETSGLKKWRDEQAWDQCFENFHLTRVYPYVQAFFQSLSDKKIGIVTNSPLSYASRLLEYHQIAYDHIVAYQKYGRNKPYPDQLLSCAQELSIKPERCMYIGDDICDVVSAKVAGYHSVAFCVDNQHVEELVPYMPEVIISDYLQLSRYIHNYDDISLHKKKDVNYEQALEAKKKNNGQKYLGLLREASELGNGKAQYKLSKLLKKNPLFVEGDKDADFYLWESAKMMTPEAIYEIGFQYKTNGETEKAEKFFRTAANLELPHAQFHFGQTILTKGLQLSKINISKRWMEKSVVNGLSKGRDLLEKVNQISNFEAELCNHMLFDRKSEIFYLDSYIPEKRKDDFFSLNIIKVKNKEESGIKYFLERFENILIDGIAICFVPSSDKDNIYTGIRRIAQGLISNEAIDAIDSLFRYQSKEKSSQGGNRSIEAHLNTMIVRNESKIKGNHILLLDDITTTGSALNATEQLLLKAGALHVTKLALGKTK